MKQYNVYTKLDGHIGKFSGGGSDVTKAYVDKQLETKANKTELAEYAKTTEVTKTVSSEIAKVIADAPASFDTLKEISDWIDTHEDSASAMNTAIQKNTADISSLQISKANSTDLTAHTDNSDIHVTLEEKSNFHTHNNKNYLDKISENSSGNLTYNGKEITGGSTITDISDCTVNTIEEVKERTPISPKDKMKLIVGKIVKTFADIKNIAFSGSISDITDFDTVLSTSLLSTESGKRALDEAVGKILNDKIEEIKNLQGSTDISGVGDGTVTGALSTLNSNLKIEDITSKCTIQDGIKEAKIIKYGKIVFVYFRVSCTGHMLSAITGLPSCLTTFFISSIYINASPFNPMQSSSAWLSGNKVDIYTKETLSSAYVSFSYICK